MSRPTSPPFTTGNNSSSSSGSFLSPPRSTTFTHHRTNRLHIPHQPHRTHHHHRHDPSVPQSATQQPSHHPFGDFITKTTSRIHSDGAPAPPHPSAQAIDPTRPSLDLTREDATRAQKQREEAAAAEQQLQQRSQARNQHREIERLRRSRRQVDEELRGTLASLSDLSTRTTRRLDYTYYSLLTSFSALRAGIHSLHGLAKATRQLESRFAQSTAELAGETGTALRSADEGFEVQRRRVEGLEARLVAGRERVAGLGQRLDAVKGQVERLAERDGEERRRARGWWRMSWATVGVLGMVLLAAWVWRGLREPFMHEPPGGLAEGSREARIVTEINGVRGSSERYEATRSENESIDRPARIGDRGKRGSESRSAAEATLRLLDEL